jgi:hypothetical protein
MAQCIFGHVSSISPDFVDSNRALPNLHDMSFVFSHTLDPEETSHQRHSGRSERPERTVRGGGVR